MTALHYFYASDFKQIGNYYLRSAADMLEIFENK